MLDGYIFFLGIIEWENALSYSASQQKKLVLWCRSKELYLTVVNVDIAHSTQQGLASATDRDCAMQN